jgi:hypothetical protein
MRLQVFGKVVLCKKKKNMVHKRLCTLKEHQGLNEKFQLLLTIAGIGGR